MFGCLFWLLLLLDWFYSHDILPDVDYEAIDNPHDGHEHQKAHDGQQNDWYCALIARVLVANVVDEEDDFADDEADH